MINVFENSIFIKTLGHLGGLPNLHLYLQSTLLALILKQILYLTILTNGQTGFGEEKCIIEIKISTLSGTLSE